MDIPALLALACHGSGSPRLWIRAKGNYHVWDARRCWVDTGVAPTSGGWDEIEMEVRFGTNTQPQGIVKGVALDVENIEEVRYDVRVRKADGREGEPVRIAGDVPAQEVRSGSEMAVEICNYATGGETGSLVSCWDDLAVRVADGE